MLVVRLAGGDASAEADFAYDLTSERLQRVVKVIEANRCSFDDLRDIGASLRSGLLTGKVGELFESVRGRAAEVAREPGASKPRYLLRLHLPAELEALPWEALYFERDLGFIASHPQYAVLRAPPGAIEPPAAPPALAGKLRVLAVIPSGSGLDVEREWNNLQHAVGKLGERVQLQRLSGRVSPDLLEEKLRAGYWDVVHFSGHGELSASGHATIRLNDEAGDEIWMAGEAFGHLFINSGVRLAVLNCCLGATAPSSLRGMSGVGHFLLRAGVPAVVAMRFEIPDAVAVRFSDRFYQELLTGRIPGRVDFAVESAREAIFRNQSEDAARDFVTPALFLVPGCECLFELPAAAEAQPEPAVTVAPVRGVTLPAALIEAFGEGSCVPVVGPRVLAGIEMRGGADQVTPTQLARLLAERFAYPYQGDFELCASAGDWMDFALLQRVCQHVEAVSRKKNEYYRLPQAVQAAYRTSRPSALLSQIAEWNAPGVFYLYFDGLLEDAFGALRRPLRIANRIDQAVPAGSDPLLVHLRGSHRDVASLVLTEQDNDRLWDSIGHMTPEIVELVRGHIGRSLLFIGANPRDPLVKRLTSKLLDQTSARTMGPVFFLCRPGEKGDPYWENYPVIWVEGELEDLVAALSDARRQRR